MAASDLDRLRIRLSLGTHEILYLRTNIITAYTRDLSRRGGLATQDATQLFVKRLKLPLKMQTTRTAVRLQISPLLSKTLLSKNSLLTRKKLIFAYVMSMYEVVMSLIVSICKYCIDILI